MPVHSGTVHTALYFYLLLRLMFTFTLALPRAHFVQSFYPRMVFLCYFSAIVLLHNKRSIPEFVWKILSKSVEEQQNILDYMFPCNPALFRNPL